MRPDLATAAQFAAGCRQRWRPPQRAAHPVWTRHPPRPGAASIPRTGPTPPWQIPRVAQTAAARTTGSDLGGASHTAAALPRDVPLTSPGRRPRPPPRLLPITVRRRRGLSPPDADRPAPRPRAVRLISAATLRQRSPPSDRPLPNSPHRRGRSSRAGRPHHSCAPDELAPGARGAGWGRRGRWLGGSRVWWGLAWGAGREGVTTRRGGVRRNDAARRPRRRIPPGRSVRPAAVPEDWPRRGVIPAGQTSTATLHPTRPRRGRCAPRVSNRTWSPEPRDQVANVWLWRVVGRPDYPPQTRAARAAPLASVRRGIRPIAS